MKSKILIIEDNVMNLELVADLLEINGFQVVKVDNAKDGIQVALSERPDLILMDIQLPGMDGLTASRILKGMEETSDIPIVALTAYAMIGDEQKASEAGCVGYITKPIDTHTFPVSVARFVEKFGPPPAAGRKAASTGAGG